MSGKKAVPVFLRFLLMRHGDFLSETGRASIMLRLAGASMIILMASSAFAGVCNGVGGWTSCTDNNGNQTTIWNYGNGHINTQTTDRNGKTRSEYYYDWNKDNNEDR